MNGPEHYREAERLAESYKKAVEAIEAGQPFQTPAAYEDARLSVMLAGGILAKAQVHATLAQAEAQRQLAVELRSLGREHLGDIRMRARS